MTSAEKKLQIANMALLHLGQTKITQAQLTAASIPSASAIDLFWDPCRDEVLGESDWPFATCTETLSAISTITDAEYEYVYTYPTSAVSSVWAVFDEGSADKKEEQEFIVKYVPASSNKFIFSHLSDAIAEYTYQVTDALLWSHKFNIAFSYRLAAEVCVPITGDVQKGLQLMQVYNAMLGEAKRIGSSEKVKKPTQTSKYLESR